MPGTLFHRERLATGTPDGLLVLHHGRGSDENDLLGLADSLDPRRRLRVVAVRAPLHLPGSPGWHWYVARRVGHPDGDTFYAACRELGRLHDELWAETGIDPARTVLGGFSMGSVMSYALGLAADRPAPAGILAFSGFIPTVEGWRPSFAGRSALRAFIAHGRNDPVIEIAFARHAREILEHGGLEVDYCEGDGGHWIEPEHARLAAGWLEEALPLKARR